MWHPLKEFEKKGIKRVAYTAGKAIGTSNVLLNETKVPNAFYCDSWNKVAGIFDVTN